MICECGKYRLYRFGLEYYIYKERAGGKGTEMGRGNIHTRGDYEGLYYIDYDYLDYYTSKEADEYGEFDNKLLADMDADDFNDYEYDDDLSCWNAEDYINMFVNDMTKKFGSFVATGETYGTIMKNSLFEIKIEDNEWSYAIELIQKDDYTLSGLQKKHYKQYLDGMKDVLLDLFPEIGCWTGNCWTHGVIKRAA